MYTHIIEQRETEMENLNLYTKAELQLMVLRHKEGRVILPAKMLKEVQKEIGGRK